MRHLIAFIVLILPTSLARAELRYFLLEITRTPAPKATDLKDAAGPEGSREVAAEDSQTSPTLETPNDSASAQKPTLDDSASAQKPTLDDSASAQKPTLDDSASAQKPSAAPKQSKRLITTSLDPMQYSQYYPLQSDETLRMVDTWMCRGATNLQAPCPSPRTRPKTQSAGEAAVPPATLQSDQLQ
ncbi:MAG: hypothetical protein COT74_12245 [Bdellovibrionales bacterium CG10_big_fil_rev_8_21_14_0_10_45_34]|nr:MAG: hypothetical protein COT74_12245 [Bdellovibrionales bacterium CG10_big_fil_rev_8_21_14_0_10_45_34]